MKPALKFQIEHQLIDAQGIKRSRAGRMFLQKHPYALRLGERAMGIRGAPGNPNTDYNADYFEIETPTFMPVGTQGTVKAVTTRELREMQGQHLPSLFTSWS